MNLSFQAEIWTDIVSELAPLLHGQWEELGLYRDIVPMDMDWDTYARASASGSLHVTTGRDNGRLIGWYVNMVFPHQHYKTTLYGFNDFYYVIPEYRVGTVGLQLFMAMEECLRSIGVKALISISKKHRPVDSVFLRLGWQEAGTTYLKVLE